MATEQIAVNPLGEIVSNEPSRSPFELRPVDGILRGPLVEAIRKDPDAARLGVWFKVIFPGHIAWDNSRERSIKGVLEQDVSRIRGYSRDGGPHTSWSWPQLTPQRY